jgi:cytidylate kinase
MGAIIKPPIDVIVYLDAIRRDRIKRELKRNKQVSKVSRRSTCGRRLFEEMRETYVIRPPPITADLFATNQQ